MSDLFHSFSRLTAAAAAPRGQAIALLVGLGLLGLALLVLMLTRWGQVKPLSKCMVLSIMAHLLLIACAYCVRTFAEVSLPGADEVVSVTWIESEELPRPEPEPEPGELRPWEEIGVDQPPDVPPATPARPASDEPSPERLQEPADPPEQTHFPEVAVPPAAELPVPTEIADSLPREIAPAAEAILEMPLPPAPLAAAPPSEVPQAQQPPRMPGEGEPALTQRSVPAELPAELLAGSEQMQRLTDLPSLFPLAEALPGDTDHPRQSENRPGEATQGTQESLAGDRGTVPLTPIPMASIPPGVFHQPYREASLRRAADGDPLPAAYRGRRDQQRAQLVARNGGNADTEAAVLAALAWLAANQESDGRWNASRHGSGRETNVLGHDRGGAGTDADTGISGLALLAFLGNGQSHLEGQHRLTVQQGLGFLLCTQAPDGNLAGEARLFARMYCHGMATLAISEAYAMTGDPRLRPYVERAIAYTVRAQNPADGGWRYQPGDAGDTSQFGWQLMAIRSAELAGISVPASTHAGMRRFLHSVKGGRLGGLASYRPYGAPTASMTAEALACRLFLQSPHDDPATLEAVDLMMQEPPHSGKINLYYWYYATIALFQLRGPAWETWNAQLQARLLAAQETADQNAGSFPSDTVWGGYGGRVYTTAMAALCLEVYYRYLPILDDARP